MKKILYLAPHMSTGGMPQYLYKKAQLMLEKYEVCVIEHSNLSDDFVVQKNRLKDLLGDKFISIGSNKNRIIEIINEFRPDVIHLEEIPEFFLEFEIAEQIYKKDRTYKLFETSHDSSFNTDSKVYLPDAFLLVSNYQIENFKKLGIPCHLVEYPIEYKKRQDRESSLKELGLDPKLKHVINVGLFTSRKNQGEVIEYARQLIDYPIQFHFIGNQAENFSDYWRPLLSNLPKNCKIWGERSDVDKFYNASDLFLFTSRGSANDKETSPLVIREAISWGIPSLIYNLPVYLNMYDGYENISFLNQDMSGNKNLILEKLLLSKEVVLNEIQEHKEEVLEIIEDVVLEEKIEIDRNMFVTKFTPDENKIEFIYTGSNPIKIEISIKDIDSRACIYSISNDFSTGSWVWAVPLPKHVIDFQNNPNFGGFLVEYRHNGLIIETKEIRIKDVPYVKTVADFSNTEPIFMNYTEFFDDKIYDHLDIHNMNTVFDIGASVGLWTKLILSKGAKKIYSFEPNRKAVEIIKNNFKDEKRVIVVENAVYYKKSKIPFYVDENNSLISSLLKETNNKPSYEVDTVTIDEMISKYNIDKIDLIKMDIEGAEFEIFDNISKETLDKVDSLLIEYHDFYFQDGTAKVDVLIKNLENFGYKITRPEGYKVIFASKIKKNYWINTKTNNSLLQNMNLYDSSKVFTWENHNKGLQNSYNQMYNELHFLNDEYTNGCVYERLGCKIEEGDVVVDIGANIGMFSNISYYKGASKIYCFEPGDLSFSCLSLNRPLNSEIFKLAISDTNGIIKLSLPDPGDTMGASILKEYKNSNNVQCVTLDYLFENSLFDTIDFLKIDTEGSEYKILNGISDTNLSKIKKISLEFHKGILDEDMSDKILKRLENNGFKIFKLFLGDGNLRIYNFWR